MTASMARKSVTVAEYSFSICKQCNVGMFGIIRASGHSAEFIPKWFQRIHLIVSAGRVEGISSTDKQCIIVFLQKNFNKVVALVLMFSFILQVSTSACLDFHVSFLLQ